jgi:MFS transporter, SET family, sugar efflux transporter
VTATLFAVTGLVNLVAMPAAGALADRIGTVHVLLLGVILGVVFAMSSALVPNVALLAVTQILHGGYAACVLAVGLALAHRVAGSSVRGIAVFQAAQGVAGLLGHFVGGAVAQQWSMAMGFRYAGVACLAGGLILMTFRRSEGG